MQAVIHEGCELKVKTSLDLVHEGRVYRIDKFKQKLTLFTSTSITQ